MRASPRSRVAVVVRVRLLRSDRWLHARLLSEATPPTAYRWASAGEEADISIFLSPLHPDPRAPERLCTLKRHDLRGLFVFSQADIAVPWAPGVFTSLPARRAGPEFAGGCYLLPGYEGVGELLDETSEEPDLLWSFVGTVRHHRAVRGRIVALNDERALARDAETWNAVRWARAGDDAVRRGEVIAAYAQSVARAKFVVAPRGKGPSSLRLFEAMRAGRVPVIVSDDWLPPALVDWHSCALRIREADVGNIPAILREREADAEALGRRAREVWEANFSPRTMVHHMVASCLQLNSHNTTRQRRAALALKALTQHEALRRAREGARARRAIALGQDG